MPPANSMPLPSAISVPERPISSSTRSAPMAPCSTAPRCSGRRQNISRRWGAHRIRARSRRGQAARCASGADVRTLRRSPDRPLAQPHRRHGVCRSSRRSPCACCIICSWRWPRSCGSSAWPRSRAEPHPTSAVALARSCVSLPCRALRASRRSPGWRPPDAARPGPPRR